MKSLYVLVTGAMFGILASIGTAQVTLTEVFRIQDGAGTHPWFNGTTTAGHPRGMAHNPATGHVLVTDLDAAVQSIQILDGSTGADIGELDVTGVTGGTVPAQKVRVASDGTIYAASLSVAGNPFKIYRFANEGSSSTAVVNVASSAVRRGDSFDVTGTGTGTKFVASGSGVLTVDVFTTVDGNNFTFATVTPSPALAGNSQVAWDSADPTKFWARRSTAASAASTLYDSVSGAGSTSGFSSTFSGPIDVKAQGSRNLMAVCSVLQAAAATNAKSSIYDIAAPAGAALYVTGPTEKGSTEFATGSAVANTNGTGDVSLAISAASKLYNLNTNNTITAWNVPSAAGIDDWNLF